MKPTEAAALLTICAAYDNRKPDVDAAKAWAMALDGYRFEDCRDAIVAHYRVSREWIMPADVLTAVKKLRGVRIASDVVAIPPGFDPDDTVAYQRLLLESRQAQADGREVVEPEYIATRNIAELAPMVRALPPSKPTAVDARRTRDPEHARRRAEVEAELAAKPKIPLPPDHEPPPVAPTPEREAAS